MIKNEIDEIAMPLLQQVLKEAQNQWLDPDSKYKDIRSLQIDKRGSFGERFFSQTLSKIYYRRLKIEYNDGDQDDWDLMFNGIKFEIKTASIDVNNKFQNEGIKQDGDYDAILFLGIKPNELYVKFVLKQNIPFNTLHNRRKNGTGSGYKWDFKEKDMVKIETLQDMQTEFDKHFSFIFKAKK
jgi:hypothetical protein